MQSGTHFAILHFFAPAKTCKICLLGPPPIPRQGPLTPPYQTLHRWSGYAPLRALNTGGLTGWEYTSWFEAPGRTRSRPVRDDEKAADGGPFPEFGFQYPISVLQECIYSCPACRDCFRWDRDSRRAWKQSRRETEPRLIPGLSCGTIEPRFRGVW